jgi:ketosteroid isomerase-like protein
MASNETEANLELALDWLDALRRGDVDSIVERFHPDVDWVAVSGEVACEGREQVLEWLRASGGRRHEVVALELLADDSHAIVGIQDPTYEELAGVKLDGRLYVVFTVEDGRIAHIRDHAERASALAEARLGDHRWH